MPRSTKLKNPKKLKIPSKLKISSKLKIPNILDLILNLLILGVLIAIIILLVKCQKRNKELFSGFDPETRYACSKQKHDPNWINNTMCHESKFVIPESNKSRYIATNPIHDCSNFSP